MNLTKHILLILFILTSIIFNINSKKNLIIPNDEINQNPYEHLQKYNIYKYIKIIKIDYIVKKYTSENYNIYFYSNEDDWNSIKNGNLITGSRRSSDPLLIYYKIDTKEKISSIVVIAKNIGGLNNNFNFIIEDIKGKVLFKSKDYSFTEFSENGFEAKEFEVNLVENPKEIIIKLSTYYQGNQNWLSIGQLNFNKSFSIIFADQNHYLRSNNINWGIFIKTIK